MPSTAVKMAAVPKRLEDLRNVGPATLGDLRLLGIASVGQLAAQDADALYIRLSMVTGTRHDPCVHDTFSAAIHQARTGEALDWWAFTPLRKQRQVQKLFPVPF